LLGAATDVALVLAGPLDPRFPQGNALARRHGVEDRVTVLGEVPASDLPALYSAAAAFAFPSFEEGFGLPPLEAMACGTPVVCSAASALPEVVGDAALLVDPADASAIAVALRRVLDDASLRERLIESGLARVARLRWPPIAAATWQVYREVAGSC
jgi:glycosyltransferase involved in cell wall biosynthesis